MSIAHSKRHTSDLLEGVRLTLAQHRMIRPRQSILVGVSGGPDSLALLSVLVALRKEMRFELQAAYVDHGLRPAAARREAKRVGEVGRLLGVPVHQLRRVVTRPKGISLEAAARQVRYKALTALAARTGCTALALGHTQDDQAETVFLWLLRGTGTTGLAGIPPVRGLPLKNRSRKRIKLIRPLIGSSREAVRRHLKAHGICALEDRSNRSLRFLRNRVRLELIPLLERNYNPQVKRHLAVLAQILREDLGLLEQETLKVFRQAARVGKGTVRFNKRQTRQLPPTLRRGLFRLAVARLQGDKHGFAARHWLGLERLLLDSNGKSLDLPHGFRAESAGPHWLRLRHRAAAKR